MSRYLFRGIIAASLLVATQHTVLGQSDFPSKPIKIILPIPPGSALDVATRAISEQLTARWGQQVIVETRPGGGGVIAAQAVATWCSVTRCAL